MKYIKIIFIILALIILPACVPENAEEPENEQTEQLEKTEGDIKMPELITGISWPATQALPVFGAPAEILHTLHTNSLSPDERVTVSALQGIVNKAEPRILLTE